MLYGNEFRENVTNSTLINLPDWYLKGLISYISREWDFDIENRVKDGILSGDMTNLTSLPAKKQSMQDIHSGSILLKLR